MRCTRCGYRFDETDGDDERRRSSAMDKKANVERIFA